MSTPNVNLYEYVGQAMYGDYGNGQSQPVAYAFIDNATDINSLAYDVDGLIGQFYPGRCCHIGRSDKMRPGCVGTYVPITIINSAGAGDPNEMHSAINTRQQSSGVFEMGFNEDHRVDYDEDDADAQPYAQNQTPKVGGFVHTGAYTYYTTEIDLEADFNAGDVLHSPTINQINATDTPNAAQRIENANAGKVYKEKDWPNGAGSALVVGTDHIMGISRFSKDYVVEEFVEKFWPTDERRMVDQYKDRILVIDAWHVFGGENMDTEE